MTTTVNQSVDGTEKGGENMVMDSIQEVTETEARAKERRDAAVAKNKQLLIDAQKEARQIVAKARQEGEAKARQMMAEAEAQAAEATEQVLVQARQACETLKADARTHLDQAAELIVEKVVNR